MNTSGRQPLERVVNQERPETAAERGRLHGESLQIAPGPSPTGHGITDQGPARPITHSGYAIATHRSCLSGFFQGALVETPEGVERLLIDVEHASEMPRTPSKGSPARQLGLHRPVEAKRQQMEAFVKLETRLEEGLPVPWAHRCGERAPCSSRGDRVQALDDVGEGRRTSVPTRSNHDDRRLTLPRRDAKSGSGCSVGPAQPRHVGRRMGVVHQLNRLRAPTEPALDHRLPGLRFSRGLAPRATVARVTPRVSPSPLDGIRRALHPISERFHQAGFQLYVVGGIVRDLLLGLPTTGDIDLTTDALPEQTRALTSDLADAIWSQGARFGTIGLRFADLDVEITTFRSESYDPSSRKPVVSFGRDLHTDLSRRDFTINAMAASVHDGLIIDPFDGVGDLENRVLRTPLDADISFSDDPLRLMRAARFIARFDLRPTDDLSAAATRNAARLPIVSIERVRDEFERLLDLPAPTPGLRFLSEHCLLSSLLPTDVPATFDVDTALLRAAVTGPDEPEPLKSIRRGGFLFDLGPVLAERHLRHLRYPSSQVAGTAALIEFSRRLLRPDPSPSDLRRLVADSGPAREPQLLDAAADLAGIVAGSGRRPESHRALVDLRRTEDLSDLEPPIDGRQIIDRLGLAPGPAVGKIVAALRQRRIDHGPFTAAQALDLLPDLAAREGVDHQREA